MPRATTTANHDEREEIMNSGRAPAWTRRQTIGHLAGMALAIATMATSSSLAGSAAAHPGKESKPMETERRTFVLVHGAWHGGWSWRRVAPLLRAAGHDVYTPTLSGLADRAHLLTPETELETHIQDIASLLDYEELEEVILVGHSYAGMVIAGVAAVTPDSIGHLVYLDAFVPGEGDSLVSLLPPDRVAYYQEQAATHGDGWRVPPPPIAVWGITDAADVAWLETRLTDQPLRSFTQPLLAAPPELPGTYIHCTEGPIVASFAPFATAARADASWSYHELSTGHDAMVTAPRQLAEILMALGSADSAAGQ
jgi:pimeloyl-ACP methyl ester carboxylesterase